MSIENRRKRVAGLSAVGTAIGVGLALTQASSAASIGVNLVTNGDFEDVTALTQGFGATEVGSGWTTAVGGSVFAYNYGQNYDDDRNNPGFGPPGNDLTSGTDYYFTLNTTGAPAIQNIDLSSGDTASEILGGSAQYDVRAFYTNYLNDLEGGRLTLAFYDGDPGADGTGANLIATAVNFTDPDLDAWSEIGGTGAIDPNAKWARLSLEHDPATQISGGPDVYVDNVSFSVISVPEPSAFLLGGLSGLVLLLRRKRG